MPCLTAGAGLDAELKGVSLTPGKKKTPLLGNFSSVNNLKTSDAGATREIGCRIPRKLNFAKEARAQYGGQFSLVRIGIEKPERGGNTAQ